MSTVDQASVAAEQGPRTESIYTRLPEALATRTRLRNPWLWNFLLLGLPVWAVFNIAFALKIPSMNASTVFLVSFYVASMWVWLGPLLILTWERRFRQYSDRISESASKEGWQDTGVIRARIRFDSLRSLFGGGFLLLALTAQVLSMHVLDSFLGTHGLSDPVQWMAFVVTAAMTYASGIGIWGVLKGIAITQAVAKTQLTWFPLHPDGLGGYGFIGNFCLATTLIFSCGSIAIPATMEVAGQLSGVARAAVGSAALLFAIAVAASFLIPTVSISRLANEKKKHALERLAIAINQHSDFLAGKAPHEEDSRVERSAAALSVLLEYYSRVRSVVIYPFGLSTLAKLLASIAFPVLLFMAEFYLGGVFHVGIKP